MRKIRSSYCEAAWPALAICAAWTLPVPALAQSVPPSHQQQTTELAPITVTAEKTSRLLEQVPASIAVIDGLDIEQTGIQRMEQLEGRMPGLSFQPFGQSGLNSPVMRGVTANFNTSSTSVLMLVDGVPTLTAQGFENSFLDLDRIEVLRGPQSTLYGRNAEAGVVSIHTQPMDNTPRAAISGEFGSRAKRAGSFSLSQPITQDTLYGSISGSWSSQHGFINNSHTGKKDDRRERGNLNIGLRWTPTPATDVVLRYARQEFHDGSALWGSPSAERNEVASGTAGWNKSVGQTFSLSASHQFASGLTLRSITAYNDYRDRVQQDTDFMPMDVLHVGRDHHFRNLSQELRIEGKAGKADWLVGVYADKQDNDLVNISKTMMGSSHLQVGQKGSSLALFTHWNVPLSDAWTVSLGGRIERNNVSIAPDDKQKMSEGWTHFSPKLALQYQMTPDHQWYISVAKGIRTGGFNVVSPAANFMPYSPEKTLSYETGLKGSFDNRRGRYSIAAYYMTVRDMQVMQMPTAGMMYITSAAAANAKGIELDFDYMLAPGWRVNAGLAWNHTRFERFQDGMADYSGKRNPFAPDLSGHAGVRYTSSKGWYAQAQVVGTGKVYLDAANKYKRNGYGLINLTAGYAGKNWEVAAYVNNAANKKYDAVGYQNGFVTVYSPPREVGMRLTWRL
ncbi:TonB-dependent receptor [Advenella sp. S44]|uniref:TonB-dependent receptor n=1 Tax=Advenella kashmirensis TaxID=310575 RepID=A0A356LB01_9BURK|nr:MULTISPECIES: TonB-dependent receptor [unclassified Advenella]PJX20349.1 TonB-dependent receptor [Advenella sp. S44]HBP28167.1 TonB-dependent receptor [Advenella kashmirensis]